MVGPVAAATVCWSLVEEAIADVGIIVVSVIGICWSNIEEAIVNIGIVVDQRRSQCVLAPKWRGVDGC